MAVFAKDAFGVKLHALNRQVAMSDAHDLTIIGMGGDFQHIRQAGRRNRQRVVTIDCELPRQMAKNPLLRRGNHAGFTVH